MGKKFIGFDVSSTSVGAIVYDYGVNEIVAEHSIDMDELASDVGVKTIEGMVEDGEGNFVLPGTVIAQGADRIMEELAVDDSFDNADVYGGSVSFQGHFTALLRDGIGTVLQNGDVSTPLHKQIAEYLTCDFHTWKNNTTKKETADLNEQMEVAELNVIKMAERYPASHIHKHVGTPAYNDASEIMCGNAFFSYLLTGVRSFSGPGDAAASGFVDLDSLKLDSRAMVIVAPGLENKVTEVTPPGTIIGKLSSRYQKMGFTNMSMSTGDQDNIKSAAYAIFKPGILQISLGTSYTAYIVSKKTIPGFEGNFASNDAECPYVLLLCKQNGSDSLTGVLSMHHYSKKDFDRLSRSLRCSPAGNDGKIALPWFGPEITPYAPDANGMIRNGYEQGFRADARAAAEGNAASLIHAARETLGKMGAFSGVSLVGGGGQNKELSQIWADMAGVDCYDMAKGSQAAAIGAALTAAVDYENNQPGGIRVRLQDAAKRFMLKYPAAITEHNPTTAAMYKNDFMPKYVEFEGAHSQKRK
jgi:xylulokinase